MESKAPLSPSAIPPQEQTSAEGGRVHDTHVQRAQPLPATTAFYTFLAPPETPDEMGRLGGYRVLKLLGEGGMGYVFLGQDPVLERGVALKVMKPDVAAQPLAKDRFLREGRAAAALKSDHIVSIYQVGESNGVPFMAMELLDGLSLEDYLAKKPKVTDKAVMKVAADVLRALSVAHAKRLIHRDIKPANLWVETGTNRVKVLDFGLTRSSEKEQQLTMSGAVVGTPSYMAPEQAHGHAVDERADLFSLGVVLYRMAEGHSPFSRDSIMATLLALTQHEPDAPKAVSPELSAFIMGLLKKDLSERTPSAQAALTRLREIERRLATAVVTPPPMAEAVEAAPVPDRSEFEFDEPSATQLVAPASAKHPRGEKPGTSKRLLFGLLGLFLIGVGGFIVINITNKDGTVTELKVEDNAKIEVNGKTIATKPEEKEAEMKKEPPQVANVKAVAPEKAGEIDYASERKAATALLKLGKGKFHLKRDGHYLGEMKEPLPAEDFYVHHAELNDSDFRDEDLAPLRDCARLEILQVLGNPRLTPVGLSSLGKKQFLETVWIDSSLIGQGLVGLIEGSPAVQSLSLGFLYPAPARDFGVLRKWKGLRSLGIGDVLRITLDDAVLSQIVAGCPELRHLHLLPGGDSVSVSLKPLAGAKRLRSMRVYGWYLRDPDNVATLTRLAHIDTIQLDQPFDDRTAAHVAPLLKRLRSFTAICYFKGIPGLSLAGWEPLLTEGGPDILHIGGGEHALDGRTLLRFAGLRNLKGFTFNTHTPERCTYTPDDVVEFRRLRPDMGLELQGVRYTALSDWPGKFEGSTSVEPWKLPKDAPPPAIVPFSPEDAKKHQEAWAKYIKQPVEIENKIGMKFRLIPPGEFETIPLGATEGRAFYRLSRPAYLGTTEVTFAQFEKFVAATGYKTDAERSGRGGQSPLDPNWPYDPAITWRTPLLYSTDPQRPITVVTWGDASAFCDWLGKDDGEVYRLPTQAEWRFACRAGGKGMHGWADADGPITDYGWFPDGGKRHPPTQHVGKKKPNAFGLLDIHGNVDERFLDSGWDASGSAIDPIGSRPTTSHSSGNVINPPQRVDAFWGEFDRERHCHPYVGFRILRQTTKEPLAIPKFGEKPILVPRNAALSTEVSASRPVAIPGIRSWSPELTGHCGQVSRMAWSPRGDLIASGGRDGTVRLWDTKGNLKRILLGHSEWINGLDFSPDGKLLATSESERSGVSGGVLRLWSIGNGSLKAEVPIPYVLTSLAFSPAGTAIVLTAQDGLARVLNVESGTLRSIVGLEGNVASAIWSPDSSTICTLTGDNRKIQFWDATTLKPRGENLLAPQGLVQKVTCHAAWSPDGRWIVTGSIRGGKSLDLWDAGTRKHVREIDVYGNGGNQIRWFSDNTRLLLSYGGGNFFHLIDPREGKVTRRAEFGGPGSPACLSPTGNEIAAYCGDRLTFHDSGSGEVLRDGPKLGISPGQFDLLTSDGKQLVSQQRVFDSHTGELISEPPTRKGQLPLASPDHRWQAFSGENGSGVILEPTREGTPPVKISDSSVNAWSRTDSTGSRITVVNENRVTVWDAKSGQKLATLDHPTKVFQIGLSPNGSRLATQAKEGVRVWDVSSGKLVAEFKDPPKGLTEFTSWCWPVWGLDNNTLYIGTGAYMLRMDIDAARVSPPELLAPDRWIESMTLAPDGERLLINPAGRTSVREYDGTVRMLGTKLYTPWAVKQFWHPDARRFVGSGGQGVRAFDTRRMERLGTLWPQVGDKHWLCVGPDGHYCGSEGIEEFIVYVAQMDDGSHQSFTPKEFTEKFGWKNDPAKARLMKLE